MTTTWHADPTDARGLRRRARSTTSARPRSRRTCSRARRCREALAASVPAASLDRMWHEVVVSLDAPRARARGTRAARACGCRSMRPGCSPPPRRCGCRGCSPRRSALGFAVLAANLASGNDADLARFLFLVVAALLPVAGIAVAFGPGVDPTYEIGAAAPMRADRAARDARRAPCSRPRSSITGCAALAMPGLDAIAAAWLLPSLGLTFVTLALGTWWRPFVAAVGRRARVGRHRERRRRRAPRTGSPRSARSHRSRASPRSPSPPRCSPTATPSSRKGS